MPAEPPLTQHQRAYLCAFDDLLYARTCAHHDIARAGMRHHGQHMLADAHVKRDRPRNHRRGVR